MEKKEHTTTEPYLLIAEDDPDDQLLIQNALEEICPSEVKTRFVWDGMELTSLLHDEAAGHLNMPKLVIVDLNLPRKDGRTAIKEIKHDPSLEKLPLAVLTTSNHPEDIQFCRDYSVNYYQKPSSFKELKKIVNRMCKDYIS